MDVDFDKDYKNNPEYKRKLIRFRKNLKQDIVCTGLTYCIIPLSEINEAIAENQPDFRCDKIEKYYNDIVHVKVLNYCEKLGLINWWTSFCRRLYVSYSRKTNYLLYNAVSIGMWGYEEIDHLLQFLKDEMDPGYDCYFRRWLQQMIIIHGKKEILANEESVLKEIFESYIENVDAPADEIIHGDLHVYILSNILKRPIIVFGYYNITKIQGVYMHVYLPMDNLPQKCSKYPLIMACYEGNYFPILQMDARADPLSDCVPLVNTKCELAEIYFTRDPGVDTPYENYETQGKLDDNQKLSAMMEYMDVVLIPLKTQDAEAIKYPCARLGVERPSYYHAYRAHKINEFDISEKKLYYISPEQMELNVTPEEKIVYNYMRETTYQNKINK